MMSRRLLVAWALLACAHASSSFTLAAAGPSPAVGTVEGRVRGPQGEPISGVEVRLLRSSLAGNAVSGPDGAFRITAVPGTYRLICTIGSILETGPTVDIAAGAATQVDVALRLSMSEQVSVVADSWTLPSDLPNTTASRTAQQLDEQNLANPEDALRYVPNTTIRKRYIGDRNALMGGRSFGTTQPSRGLVFLDGYLLSNFLGRFDAPRWNMVTPEALERVDVMYGPFSAVYAGNSIGTTVVMTERTPKAFEWGVSLTGFGQRFSLFGDEDDYRGGQLSAFAGARSASGAWGAVSYNHQDSTSQPMQYFSVSANAGGAFPAVPGTATPVTGITYDVDHRDLRRAILGVSAEGVDDTRQDSLKLRGGLNLTDSLEASGLVGGWINRTANTERSFLHDLSGNQVWQGRVTDGVNTFNIPAAAFAPGSREENHLQLGATLRTRRSQGWNGSLVGSFYRILSDPARQANNPEPIARLGGPGTVTRRDGTGWNTLEAQGTWTPHAGDGMGARHALTLGVHRNAYALDNVVRLTPDWSGAEEDLSQRYQGDTQVIALYAQDAWRLTDEVKLTIGARQEWYRTSDGEQTVRVASCAAPGAANCAANGDGTFNKTVGYAARSLNGFSPKATLAWTVSEHLLLKGSFGRGVRFPNVEELYNGTVTATSVTLSDPALRAERSNACELSAESWWGHNAFRASVFHDDVSDAILRQTNQTVVPTITNVSNVDLVRTTGLELAWSGRDLLVKGLGLEANGALTQSKVVRNEKDPLSEDKYWLRVPKTRGSILVAYRPSEAWMASLGFRHQGRAYTDVYNLDVNPDVYGGVSSVNQVDLRLTWKPQPKLELGVGVDNVTDQPAYQFHPLPSRTMFLQLRAASR